MLTADLAPLIRRQKKVVFFDEFPWIAIQKSRFVEAFDHFWNSWESRQDNLVFAICESVASWMIRKVINNRGGLHNPVAKKNMAAAFQCQRSR